MLASLQDAARIFGDVDALLDLYESKKLHGGDGEDMGEDDSELLEEEEEEDEEAAEQKRVQRMERKKEQKRKKALQVWHAWNDKLFGAFNSLLVTWWQGTSGAGDRLYARM
jgi:hypothetical protein